MKDEEKVSEALPNTESEVIEECISDISKSEPEILKDSKSKKSMNNCLVCAFYNTHICNTVMHEWSPTAT